MPKVHKALWTKENHPISTGRPRKGHCITDQLNIRAKIKDMKNAEGQPITRYQAIADMLFETALKARKPADKINAAKLIMAYMEGPPEKLIELRHSGALELGGQIVIVRNAAN